MAAAIQAIKTCQLADIIKEFDRPGFFNIRWALVDLFVVASFVAISLV